MSRVGYYLRTSHYLQNISTQIDKIEEGWKVYKDEGVSGRVPFQDRPSGRRLIKDIQLGKIDRVIVLRLDRLGRNTSNILETINTISIDHKIPITSLNEGITTLNDKGQSTPMTGLLINVLSSLSEFFYHQTREKVLTGIQLSKEKGVYTGRKKGSKESLTKIMNKEKVIKIRELLDDNVGIRRISRVVGCSTNYVYKVKSLVG